MEVFDEIKKVPAFQTNGEFDKTRYIEVLRLNGLNPEMFEEDLKANILLNKMKGLISGSVFVNDEEILKEYKTRNKIAEISYVEITPEMYRNQVVINR